MSPRAKLIAWLVAVPLALVLAYAGAVAGFVMLGGIVNYHVIEGRPVVDGGAQRWVRTAHWVCDERRFARWEPLWPAAFGWGNRALESLSLPARELLSWLTTHAVAADEPEMALLNQAIPLLPPGTTWIEAQSGFAPGSLSLTVHRDGMRSWMVYSPAQGLQMVRL